MPNHRIFTADFYCVKCGNKGIPIARKTCSQREPGHLKKLYCPYCKAEVNHVEIRPNGSYTYEDFLREFHLGRFIDDQRVPVSDLLGCNRTTCEYNVSGKCWNANNSFDCGHKPIKEEKEDEK